MQCGAAVRIGSRTINQKKTHLKRGGDKYIYTLGRAKPVEESHINTDCNSAIVMHRALERGEFVPFMQPVVLGTAGQIVGCEVLVRWVTPNHGVVPPDLFIPLAERNGMTTSITRHLMRKVQCYFAPLAGELPPGFNFGFNVAASQLREPSLVDDCRAFLEKFAGQAISLTLEVTEREVVTNDVETQRVFSALKALGVAVALDDFGTGHANLAYIQTFEIDALKLDKRFVCGVCTDALSTHIIDNVLDLANRLGLRVVAEGIENVEQRDFLAQRGITLMQGYLFGKPLPMDDFWNILECQ